jgi:peptide/nickel transport system substrate-binding protein
MERRALFSRVALALLLCGATHCSKADREASAASRLGQEGAPASGGELVFGFDGAAITEFNLDPEKSLFAPHHRIMRSIVDSLVVAQPGHAFGPWLAKSWEISPDGREYTFHLRGDVTFHDGTKFDAEAVKFNFDRIREPKNALYAVSDLGPYTGATVIDPTTVRVTFSEPYAPFLANLSKTTLGMVSPAAVQKYGDDFPHHPVGTGPFRFHSLEPAVEVVLDRNPDYKWPPSGAAHAGPAWLDRITFKNVPEEATRVAVLLNGQANAVDLVPPQNVAELRSSSEYRLLEGELLNQNYSLYLNVKRPPWDDQRVRTAFREALDLDAAVKTVYLGTFDRGWSPLSPSLFGYDKTLEHAWHADPADAARLLDEVGWKKGADGVRVKDGKPLTVVFVDTQGNREKRLDLMTVLRKQLRDAGFDLKLDTQPSGAYMAKIQAGEYDLVAGSLFASDPDVLRRLNSRKIRSAFAVSKVDDPELEALLEAGAEESDSGKRAAIYRKAQHIIIEKTYAIPTYVLKYNVATSQAVHGVAIDVAGFPVLYDTWIAR